MDLHPRRRWLAALAGVLCMAGTGAAAGEGDGDCTQHDLGPFSICAPRGWKLVKNGTDSAAGRFTAEGLQLSYDFGLNSDPLRVPAGAANVDETAVAVDGVAARRVRYSLQRGEGLPVQYLGVHVAEVRRSRMGRLKLTLLAHARDQDRFGDVDAALSTIRFKSDPAR